MIKKLYPKGDRGRGGGGFLVKNGSGEHDYMYMHVCS